MNLKSYILYPLALAFFIADICLFALTETNLISLTLCFYIVVLVNQKRLFPTIFCLFLLSLKYFLFYSQILTPIYITIFISIFGRWAQAKLKKRYFINYIILILLVIMEQFLIKPSIFELNLEKIYTFLSICANILVTAIFLKLFVKGRLGNRL